MADSPDVKITFSATDNVSPVAEKVRAGIKGLGDGAIDSTEGLRRVRTAAVEMGASFLGASGPLAKLTEGLSEFGAGGAVVTAVGAGLGLIGGLFSLLTEQERKAMEGAVEAAKAVEASLQTAMGALLERMDKLQQGVLAAGGLWDSFKGMGADLYVLITGGDVSAERAKRTQNEIAQLQRDIAVTNAQIAKERERQQEQETDRELQIYGLRAKNGQLAHADALALAAIESQINQLLAHGNLTTEARLAREKELQEIARIRQEAIAKADQAELAQLTTLAERIKQQREEAGTVELLQRMLDDINKRLQAGNLTMEQTNRLEAIRNKILEDRQLLLDQQLLADPERHLRLTDSSRQGASAAQQQAGLDAANRGGPGLAMLGAGGQYAPGASDAAQQAWAKTHDVLTRSLDSLTNAAGKLGDGLERAFARGIASGKGLGHALEAVKHQLGQEAVLQAQHDAVAAISAGARFLFTGDATQAAAAASFAIAAAEWAAFAAVLGGGGGAGGSAASGGGGGLAPRSAQQNALAPFGQGTVTVQLPANAMLRAGDPVFQQFFADVAQQAQGRRLIFQNR